MRAHVLVVTIIEVAERLLCLGWIIRCELAEKVVAVGVESARRQVRRRRANIFAYFHRRCLVSESLLAHVAVALVVLFRHVLQVVTIIDSARLVDALHVLLRLVSLFALAPNSALLLLIRWVFLVAERVTFMHANPVLICHLNSVLLHWIAEGLLCGDLFVWEAALFEALRSPEHDQEQDHTD